jgi:hypothetical protein
MLRTCADSPHLRSAYKACDVNAPLGSVRCKRCECWELKQRNAAVHPRVWPAGTSIHLGGVSLQRSSLNAATAEVTTLRNITVPVNGKRKRWRWKVKSNGRRLEGWRLHAPASSQIGSSGAFS